MRSVYDRLPPNGRLTIAIRGANHSPSARRRSAESRVQCRGAFLLSASSVSMGVADACTVYAVHSFSTLPEGDGHVAAQYSSPLYPRSRFLIDRLDAQ